MSEYKEIVTKAVLAKGKKTSTNNYVLETEESPNTILGCWVINHKFSGSSVNDAIYVNGSFDVNVWYSYDSDSKTAVSTKSFSYNDQLKLKPKEQLDETPEVIVKSLKQPTVSEVNIKDGIVNLTIDKELGIEIVGDTKIKVPVDNNFDDYESLDDDVSEEIDKAVDENYLK